MTTRIWNVKVWVLVVAVLAMTPMVSAQTASNTAGVGLQAQQVDRYIVGQAKPPETPGAPIKELTLEQAIQIALEKNLNLQVAKLNPQIQDYNLQSARAAFATTLTATTTYSNATTVSTNILDGVTGTSTLAQVNQGYNAGVSQPLPWYGGTVSANFTNSRNSSNSVNLTRNPNYTSSLRFSYLQPLLVGFQTDNPRTAIKTAQVTREVTDLQLYSTIENLKASIRTSYWALRSTIEQIEIQKRSLALANRLWEDNKTKVQIGTMAEIDVLTSETQVASGEQALLNAQIQWQSAELAFKTLLAGGRDDELFKSTINPVDQPAMFDKPNVDIPGAIQNALAARADLKQAQKNLQITDLNLQVTKDQTKPQLNLTTSYQSAGTGGNQLGKNGVVLVQSGYFDAVTGISSFNQPTWTLGFNFNYPIGMMAAHANLAKSQLTQQQQQVQLKVTELTVATDVTTAGLAVQNTYLQLQAAKKTAEAAAKNAEAEQTKFSVGLSNNYNVATAQQNLTTSLLTELAATINHLNAIAQFDLVQRVAAGGGGGGGVNPGGSTSGGTGGTSATGGGTGAGGSSTGGGGSGGSSSSGGGGGSSTTGGGGGGTGGGGV
jgi:outer membrane protein